MESAEAEPEPEPEPLGTEPWEKNVRLPKHLLPLHYDLYLHPNLGKRARTFLPQGYEIVHSTNTQNLIFTLLKKNYPLHHPDMDPDLELHSRIQRS